MDGQLLVTIDPGSWLTARNSLLPISRFEVRKVYLPPVSVMCVVCTSLTRNSVSLALLLSWDQDPNAAGKEVPPHDW